MNYRLFLEKTYQSVALSQKIAYATMSFKNKTFREITTNRNLEVGTP